MNTCVCSARARQLPLPFEVPVIDSLLREDSLLVASCGLPVVRVAAFFVAAYIQKLKANNSHGIPLILVVGYHDRIEFEVISRIVQSQHVLQTFTCRFISPDITPAERTTIYSSGGLYGATARTFVIDALAGRLQNALVNGVMVFNAHK
eukprot:Gregarina_sp_Poly_1__3091@NODE_186_length_11711_cov_65_603057_g165_i0_p8_GENE_NODE_186_length_11711_cov_65_603057_g165_i0NODE_186_length_11711_cov_65_603057_g165_i0_p8_ORF_typecomplete_len149_score12_43_NODE_186_length_11711_cov_65_603057_g165_i089059351